MTNEISEKLAAAESFIREGKELFAVQIYKQLLDENCENRTVLLRLANLYEKMKLFDKVSELLEEYLSANEDGEVAVLFGHFLMRRKNFSRAVEIFEKADKTARLDVYYFCGVARYETGDLNGALASFRNYLNSEEKRYIDKALFAATKTSYELGKFDEALEYLDRLDKISGLDRGKIFELYAKVYFAKRLFYYAQDAVEKAIKRKEFDENLFALAGKIHFNIGEYDKAERYFETLRKKGFANAEIFSLSGLTAFAKGELSKAREFLTSALELNPFEKNTIALKEKLLELIEKN